MPYGKIFIFVYICFCLCDEKWHKKSVNYHKNVIYTELFVLGVIEIMEVKEVKGVTFSDFSKL